MQKTRVNISLDKDLAEFAKAFAAENRLTVADLFTQYLLGLKRRSAENESNGILADPAFRQALEEVRAKLRAGKITWHSYDEVFGD